MTKEEAIKVLDQVRQWTDYPKEAFTMAIDALSQPSLSSNLDEAANKFAVFYDQGTCDEIAQECFKAGAEWMAEQGETHDCRVLLSGISQYKIIQQVVESFEPDEVVTVQIRKRD